MDEWRKAATQVQDPQNCVLYHLTFYMPELLAVAGVSADGGGNLVQVNHRYSLNWVDFVNKEMNLHDRQH